MISKYYFSLTPFVKTIASFVIKKKFVLNRSATFPNIVRRLLNQMTKLANVYLQKAV